MPVAWQEETPGSTGDGNLTWGLLTLGLVLQPRAAVTALKAQDRPAAFRLASGATVFVVRSGDSRRAVRLYIARDDRLDELGELAVPYDNFMLNGAVLRDGRLLVVSSGLSPGPSESPALSYVTTVAVRCGATH
jgi:hypothetical protein